MGTAKKRTTSRRNNSRQAALSFLTNITLGNEHEEPRLAASPTTLNYADHDIAKNPHLTRYGTLSVAPSPVKTYPLESSDSNSTMEESTPITLTVSASRNFTPIERRRYRRASTSDNFYHRRLSSSDSNASSSEIVQHKLTREDSQRPIASEKIKRRSDHQAANNSETPVSMSFMSVFRYYKGIIRQPRRKADLHYYHRHYPSYFHQHLSNMNAKHRKGISYGHFLLHASEGEEDDEVDDEEEEAAEDSAQSEVLPQLQKLVYDPYYINDDLRPSQQTNMLPQSSGASITRPSPPPLSKQKSNELFQQSHPDIQITLSKINAIKAHLLNIGKQVDLEISSIAHAFVYFEKLIQKQIVTKQNRKLLAACCLFLATKVNEPKGLKFDTLLEAVSAELYVNSRDIRSHEFAVFADLEFNLYVPEREFMPHFDSIIQTWKIQCMEDYLGPIPFYMFTANEKDQVQ
ncbi:cyclin [Mucor lusitanicus]|uniref:Cyclin n=2 Tax=Mucor circinelloides f. lusitanicus TaxID=29924 RepID=A0A162ZRC2_MUCCL|nr:cyclin [Mucor lusitanicus]OAD07397.1 cyclin [Mucor lusitanicus CBS 277.49]